MKMRQVRNLDFGHDERSAKPTWAVVRSGFMDMKVAIGWSKRW
jgi:hypothetical protein|eukprot:COSAG01_NODE_5650_length_4116_cov_5.166003_6_plen_43_part_00